MITILRFFIITILIVHVVCFQRRGRGRQNSRGIGRTSEVVRDGFLRNFQRRPRLLKCSCEFYKNLFFNKKIAASVQLFYFRWGSIGGCNFTDFLGFFGIFENRDFLQIVTDRGKPLILGYIGGRKKAIFCDFCEVLPIFLQKNDVGGDDDFDW